MLDSNKIPNAFSVRLYHESKSTDFLKPLKNCGCVSTDEVYVCPKLLKMTESICFGFFKSAYYFHKQIKK